MSLFQINVSEKKSFRKNRSAAFYLVFVLVLLAVIVALLIWLTRPKTQSYSTAFRFATTSANVHIKPVGKKIGNDDQGIPIYQVHANGIDIGYQLVGSGEPLVMIMGLGGTMADWPEEVVNVFAKEYQVILLDNRGMGHSTADDTKFDIKLHADDVIGLLDALGVQKTHVLGYSMGSVITQQLLVSYPERFNKAIIFATSISGKQAVKNLKDEEPNPIVQRQMQMAAQWKSPLEKMKSIANPVLLLIGTKDEVVNPHDSIVLASTIPNAWLAQFKNGTHELIFEAEVAFANTVLNFLNTNQTVER